MDRNEAEQVAKEDYAERVYFSGDQTDDHAVHGRNEGVSGHEEGAHDDSGHGIGSHAGNGMVTGPASHFGRGVAFMS